MASVKSLIAMLVVNVCRKSGLSKSLASDMNDLQPVAEVMGRHVITEERAPAS